MSTFNPFDIHKSEMGSNIGMRQTGANPTREALSINFNSDNIKPNVVFDGSGNHYHGTVSGATHVPTGGISGGGVYDFDGVDDFIELNDGMTIKELSISATEGNGSGIHMKPDGTKAYILGFANDTIREYTLSIPWDISTGTLTASKAITADATPNDLWISSDGTKLYTTGTTADRVYQYSMSTAWDISTLVLVNSYLVSGLETDPTGIFVKSDGTTYWIVGTITDTIYEYTMSTPWDITTSVYSGNSLLVSSADATVNGIRFHPNGTKFYLLGTTADTLIEYSCTAWTIVGATQTGVKFYIGTQATLARGFDFGDGGNKIYLIDDGADKIVQYNLYSPYSFSNPIYSNGFTIMADIKPDSSGEGSAGKIYDETYNSAITNGLSLYMGSSSVVMQVGGGTGRSSGTASITFGQKYRVAATCTSAGLVSFYLNGAAVGTPGASNSPSLINQVGNARIGNRANATDFTFDGYIGNVRILSRVLSAAEIAADYAALGDARDFTGIPRLTTTMRNAIVSPATGYMIFNITTNSYQTWNGSAWV